MIWCSSAAPRRTAGALKLAAVTNLTTGTPVYTGPPRGVTVLNVVLAVLLSLVAAGLVAVAIFLTLTRPASDAVAAGPVQQGLALAGRPGSALV